MLSHANAAVAVGSFFFIPTGVERLFFFLTLHAKLCLLCLLRGCKIKPACFPAGCQAQLNLGISDVVFIAF